MKHLDKGDKILQIRSCLHHGHILPQNISVDASRNPLRVAEAVHESSARPAKSYPATPIAFPGGERITPIIYVGGELAELNLFPLREIVRFAQGIALFKKRGLQ